MNAPRNAAARRSQRGLSLIEILVGLAIGMIGVLAIFQVVGIWTRHSQTTSAGGDAQVAGTLALFNLERDFKQSGHGFGKATVPVMGCDVQAFDTSGRAPPAFTFPLRPIDIVLTPGEPDQINVLYGNSSFFVTAQDFLSSTPTSKTLRRRGGFRLGDVVVIADGGAGLPGSANCSLAEITSDSNPDLLTVDHAVTGYTTFYSPVAVSSRFNRPGGPPFPYVGGSLFNLGPRPQLVNWQIVNDRSLQRSEQFFSPPPAAPDQVAEGVINLKAEYGVDVDNNTRIDAGEWQTKIPVGSNWNQVLAVRLAVLVRSRQFDQIVDPVTGTTTAVTPDEPKYFGGAFAFTMKNVDGSADAFTVNKHFPDPNNWRFYRYRVYERVIPLKNMLWALP